MANLTIQGVGVTDTTMFDDTPTTNFGTDTTIDVGEHNAAVSIRRTLIKFVLTDIPEGSIITGATLTLTVQADISSNARTLSVFRAKRAWVVSEATWNVYSTGNNWTTAGCADTTNDREGTDIGTAAIGASPTLDSEISVTLAAASIQEMLTGGSFTNNGFLLKVDTETDDCIRYYSTDNASTTKRPKLVIDYTPPGEDTGGILILQ